MPHRTEFKSSPYRRKNSPYWWIRRTIGGIGELRLSTRTKSVALARRYDTLICDLRDLGQFEALRALRAGGISFPDLYANQTPQKLEALLTRSDMPFAFPLLDEWLTVGAEDRGIRDSSMRRYVTSWKRLREMLPTSGFDISRNRRDARDGCLVMR